MGSMWSVLMVVVGLAGNAVALGIEPASLITSLASLTVALTSASATPAASSASSSWWWCR